MSKTTAIANTIWRDRVLSMNACLATRVDQTLTSPQYIAYAEMFTIDADKKWLIKRITTAAGITKEEYAIGGFVNSWNDRASLTYQ